MAISKAERSAYNQEIKIHKEEIDSFKTLLKTAFSRMNKMPKLKAYLNIEMSIYHLEIIERYVNMSRISTEMLGIKNDKALEESRKDFYRILQLMEETVGAEIDRTLKENDSYLITINRLNTAQILNFIKRIGDSLYMIKNSFGESSKWKWSFVELQARFSVIVKNITNFSDIAKLRDPRTDFFSERQEMMALCKEGLEEAAKQYRTKYELSGKAREDLKKSIDFLSALRKIHVLFGEDTEAGKLKTIIDAAKEAMKAGDKAEDKKEKRK